MVGLAKTIVGPTYFVDLGSGLVEGFSIGYHESEVREHLVQAGVLITLDLLRNHLQIHWVFNHFIVLGITDFRREHLEHFAYNALAFLCHDYSGKQLFIDAVLVLCHSAAAIVLKERCKVRHHPQFTLQLAMGLESVDERNISLPVCQV